METSCSYPNRAIPMPLAIAASTAFRTAAASSCRNGHGRIGMDSFVNVVRETNDVTSEGRLASFNSDLMAFHVESKLEYDILYTDCRFNRRCRPWALTVNNVGPGLQT